MQHSSPVQRANRGPVRFLLITVLIALGVGVMGLLISIDRFLINPANERETEDSDDTQAETDAPEPEILPEELLDMGEQEELPGSGIYAEYDSEYLENANTGDVVIFFKASWCPTCKVLDQNINEHLADIPSDLTILIADYDRETALKKKYGITYQHTLVQVDSEGNQLKKWSGGSDLNYIVSQLV